jgi:hypothetical protein
VLVALVGAACVAAGALSLTTTGPAVPFGSGERPPAVPSSPPPMPAPVRGDSAPVQVALPARGVVAPVVPVRADASGALAVPDDPATVGWWADGARPGSTAGSVVLVGHVDSRTEGIGVFAVLATVERDEIIAVRGADERIDRYRVVARRQYRKQALPADVFARTGDARLVLITCGGPFNARERSYRDNVVVYALPTSTPGT